MKAHGAAVPAVPVSRSSAQGGVGVLTWRRARSAGGRSDGARSAGRGGERGGQRGGAEAARYTRERAHVDHRAEWDRASGYGARRVSTRSRSRSWDAKGSSRRGASERRGSDPYRGSSYRDDSRYERHAGEGSYERERERR